MGWTYSLALMYLAILIAYLLCLSVQGQPHDQFKPECIPASIKDEREGEAICPNKL